MIGRSFAFHIRDARAADRPAIHALTLAAYAPYVDMMQPRAWAGLHQAVLNALNGEPYADRIVAERDGVLIGSVLLCPPTRDAYGGAVAQIGWPEIRILAVALRARGQGVAKALIAECERRAQAAGSQMIGLHTSHSLRAAVALYEQLGYRRAPAYDFQPPDAELVMAYRKKLAPSNATP